MTGRWVLTLWAGLMLLAGAALAQDEPVLRVEMPEGEVIVGQPLVLRLTVLVPTWMPKPPQYPSFEVQNLMVRLPERATTAVSERIGGETWSGTSRAYRLYPLVPGAFGIPAQTITITYADPDTTQPVKTELSVDAIRFVSVLPQGGGALQPAIVARGFALEQTVEGATDMVPGDAIRRSVTARIDGTTPILIPPLVPASEPGALRAYPDEPKVTETEDRGVLSGSRSETVSYVAQTGGVAVLPEISFDWFNLETGKVETAMLDAVSVMIMPPPPPPPDPTQLAIRAAAVVMAAVMAVFAARRALPHLRRVASWLRRRWRASEWHAHRAVLDALCHRDTAGVLAALEYWRRHHPTLDRADRTRMEQALTPIGARRYGPSGGDAAASDWRDAEAAYGQVRDEIRRSERMARTSDGLPALNPTDQRP